MRHFFSRSSLIFSLLATSVALSPLSARAEKSEIISSQPIKRLIRGTAKKPDFPKAFTDLLTYFQIPCDMEDIDSVYTALEARWSRGKKEIWELPTIEVSDKAYVWSLFKQLGVIDEAHPSQEQYEYGIILGATCACMKLRIAHLNSLYKQGVRFNQVVLKASDRPLNPSIEDEASIVKQIANTPKLSIPEGASLPTTEKEAMLFYLEHMELEPGLKQLPLVMISAGVNEKAKGSTRPGTIDPLKKWLHTNPKQGKTLLISNQPHVPYQGNLYQKLLPETFDIDCVGQACSEKFETMKILSAIYAWYCVEYYALAAFERSFRPKSDPR
jgi:hypothetical protein